MILVSNLKFDPVEKTKKKVDFPPLHCGQCIRHSHAAYQARANSIEYIILSAHIDQLISVAFICCDTCETLAKLFGPKSHTKTQNEMKKSDEAIVVTV